MSFEREAEPVSSRVVGGKCRWSIIGHSPENRHGPRYRAAQASDFLGRFPIPTGPPFRVPRAGESAEPAWNVFAGMVSVASASPSLPPGKSMAAALAENTMPQWPGCRVQVASPHRLLKLIARAASVRPDGWMAQAERKKARVHTARVSTRLVREHQRLRLT